MILSVSRRTDIPNYYSDWFFNRIREGFLCVRNPMNARQISRISLAPESVDGIVFWTKNPEPMLDRLDELAAYHYYFQFTLTGYGKDIEPGIPDKKEKMLSVFQRLSGIVGIRRVIWRYDPILFTEKYTPEYHIRAFEQIAAALNGYTSKCVISFVDRYVKNRKVMEMLRAYDLERAEFSGFVRKIAEIARANGMEAASCAEEMDLSLYGIGHNSCVDRQLLEELAGREIKAKKDRNQRPACGCAESTDVGAYNTCRNGCVYCYANYSRESVAASCRRCDPFSPLLCGTAGE
jgi:hypothetical protein